VSYTALSKLVKATEIALSSLRAYSYFLIPTLWFRQLGARCQFRGYPQFGYAFREIFVGSACSFGRGIFLNCGPDGFIKIGANVGLNDYTYLSAIHGITIGKDSRIGEFVSIRDNDHQFTHPDIAIRAQGFVGAPIEIGEDVWIGRGVFIGKGVSIGKGAVVGANSVVVKDIPPYAIAVGVPAKVIKYRSLNTEFIGAL